MHVAPGISASTGMQVRVRRDLASMRAAFVAEINQRVVLPIYVIGAAVFAAPRIAARAPVFAALAFVHVRTSHEDHRNGPERGANYLRLR